MTGRRATPKKLFTVTMLVLIGFNGLFLLISGIVYYGAYSELAYREILSARKALLDERSRKLSSYVSGVQDTTRFLVTSTTVHTYLSEPPENNYDFVAKSRLLYEEFQKLAAVKEGVYSIELYTDWLVGYPPFQQEFMHPMAQAEEEGWLGRMARADGFWIAAHDYPVRSGTIRMVSYVQRIFGYHGGMLGVVRINIPERELIEALHKGDTGADGDRYYVVMDPRGRYIASALPPDFGDIAPEAVNPDELGIGDYSLIRSDANPQYWMLMELVPKDVLKRAGARVRLLSVGLVAAMILLSVPAAFWFSRRLTSPIRGIVDGMSALEKGDFDVRLGLGGSNIREYLYLTTHFNRMVGRLKDLIGRLNQEHLDRRRAEMQLLHAQIKPHFLYNTLDLIHWRAMDYRAHEISGMVHQLSRLFRIGLGNDKWYVTVRGELDHAQCYMKIQEYRLQSGIVYRAEVPGDLLDALVPKIILQPFLENAVIHGFKKRRENMEIVVSFERRDGEAGELLIATITDNGCGLPEGFDVKTSPGIGIRNVIDRIHLFCGPSYGVEIGPADGEGTRVTIRLPLIREEAEMEHLTRSQSHAYDLAGG